MVFRALLLKEWREVVRSYKILWIPIVFMLLGVSDPLSMYFMEDIFKLAGNVPDGLVDLFPEYSAIEILSLSVGQFQSIGLIVLVAAFIGSISRERMNGTAALIYVRPISSLQLVLSKWLIASFIGIISAIAGFLGSLYYTVILFGKIDYYLFIKTVSVYCVWIFFCMAIIIMISAIFNTVLAVIVAIIITQGGLIVESYLNVFGTYSPYQLSNYALTLLDNPIENSILFTTIFISLGLLSIFLIISSYSAKLNWRKVKL